jgi:hypothetical protein
VRWEKEIDMRVKMWLKMKTKLRMKWKKLMIPLRQANVTKLKIDVVKYEIFVNLAIMMMFVNPAMVMM